MNERDKANIIDLIKKEVVPALGCTEPIAVAFACANARRILDAVPEKISVLASGNILKNAMGVGIPGTGETGLFIAAALGALGGDPDAGLEVLSSVDAGSIANARELVRAGRVIVAQKDVPELLYVEVTCTAGDDNATVIIKDGHTNIVRTECNGDVLFDSARESGAGGDGSVAAGIDWLNVETIYEFAKTVPVEDIRFLMECLEVNRALSREGLEKEYGLQIGRKLQQNIDKGILTAGMMNDAVIVTTAAIDARMAGSELPAMSNSGSGNQGITAMLPVAVAAEKLGSSEESLLRALALSNLVTIYIKSYLGSLSALCGVVIAATGASCGITLLLGGDYTAVCYAINNMTGNITGMICDGAKPGCAFKVSTGVIAAFEAAFLAVDGITISGMDGIVESDIEKTIRNLTEVGSKGMSETDRMIQRIMVCK